MDAHETVENVRVDGLCGRVYASARDPSAPVFVLLHGIGMSHRYFAPIYRALAGIGATYSFDLPGFGPTPKPSDAVSIPSYARFVEQVIHRHGISSCILVGHSMGTQLAIELSVRRPSLGADDLGFS
ncbi:MAG: alpha/beta fold hydrolase [Microbacteriaceae bacterium]